MRRTLFPNFRLVSDAALWPEYEVQLHAVLCCCCCENPREGVPLLWANKLYIIETSKIIDMKRFTPHKNIKRHVRALKIFLIHNTMSVTQK